MNKLIATHIALERVMNETLEAIIDDITVVADTGSYNNSFLP